MSKGAPDYSKITLIKGAAPDGSLVTIAVDASGQILAVLKGDYLGTPTTIAVDANGHMLANIYDPDDLFGNTGYIGLAELAARLGSAVIFDRRGQVYWYDDFESTTMHFAVAVGGAASAVARDTTRANRGDACLKLTADANSFDFASVSRIIPYTGNRKVGLSLFFSLDATRKPDTLDIEIDVQAGANKKYGVIRVDFTNAKLQVWNQTLFQDVVTGLAFVSGVNAWYPIKMVFDLTAAWKYVRLLWGDTTYDLSAVSLDTWSGGAVGITISARIWGVAAGVSSLYLDDVVVTANEV